LEEHGVGIERPRTLAEALVALEKGLKKWFDEQGIAP